MSNINDSIDPECQDSDFPWASPDDMQYQKAEAVMHDSFKNLSRKSLRDLLQTIAIDKFDNPNTRLVSLNR